MMVIFVPRWIYKYTLGFFFFVVVVVVVCFLFFVFFIRTSNFGAEAELSYIFLQFEAENVLKMFLNYMVYTTCIAVNGNANAIRKALKVHCLLRIADYDKPGCVSPLLMLYKTRP